MDFKTYFLKENELWTQIQELDNACKKNKQIVGRYVITSWADRSAVYVVVGETDSKYHIRFACGEGQSPDWGYEIFKNKKEVKAIIKGRDKLKKMFS